MFWICYIFVTISIWYFLIRAYKEPNMAEKLGIDSIWLIICMFVCALIPVGNIFLLLMLIISLLINSYKKYRTILNKGF